MEPGELGELNLNNIQVQALSTYNNQGRDAQIEWLRQQIKDARETVARYMDELKWLLTPLRVGMLFKLNGKLCIVDQVKSDSVQRAKVFYRKIKKDNTPGQQVFELYYWDDKNVEIVVDTGGATEVSLQST